MGGGAVGEKIAVVEEGVALIFSSNDQYRCGTGTNVGGASPKILCAELPPLPSQLQASTSFTARMTNLNCTKSTLPHPSLLPSPHPT